MIRATSTTLANPTTIHEVNHHPNIDVTLGDGDDMGIWDTRTTGSSTTSVTNYTSIDHSAEALHIIDTHQTIHKTAQLGLYRGLFGLYIRRGRGRPKKFSILDKPTRPRKHKTRNKNTRRKEDSIVLSQNTQDNFTPKMYYN